MGFQAWMISVRLTNTTCGLVTTTLAGAMRAPWMAMWKSSLNLTGSETSPLWRFVVETKTSSFVPFHFAAEGHYLSPVPLSFSVKPKMGLVDLVDLFLQGWCSPLAPESSPDARNLFSFFQRACHHHISRMAPQQPTHCYFSGVPIFLANFLNDHCYKQLHGPL